MAPADAERLEAEVSRLSRLSSLELPVPALLVLSVLVALSAIFLLPGAPPIGWRDVAVAILVAYLSGYGVAALCESQRAFEAPAVEGAIRYHHLWVTSEGETRIARDLKFGALVAKGFTVGAKGARTSTQLVRAFTSGEFDVVSTVVTQQLGDNPWHYAPAPQFVVTLAGRWFVRSSDGCEVVMRPGDVLYQDNTQAHPRVGRGTTTKGMHFSGSLGGPCSQLVVQLRTELQTDAPARWSDKPADVAEEAARGGEPAGEPPKALSSYSRYAPEVIKRQDSGDG